MSLDDNLHWQTEPDNRPRPDHMAFPPVPRSYLIWQHLHYLSASHQLVYWRNPLANNYLLGRIFAQLDLVETEVNGKPSPCYTRTWQFCIYRPSGLAHSWGDWSSGNSGGLVKMYDWKPVDYIPLKFWRWDCQDGAQITIEVL